jgi:hypothetical protein
MRLNVMTRQTVAASLVAAAFGSFTAADAYADALYTLEFGHSHIGLNFNVQPPDPRDRDSDPNNDVNEFLNQDGGLFPHVGIPGVPPNADTNLPVNGPYGPDQVTVLVPNQTAAPRRTSAVLDAALGNAAGDTTWILPESDTEANDLNVVWFGPEVEEDAYDLFDDPDNDPLTGNVLWSLEAVDGPGEVALWTNDQFGDVDLWMGSADGLDSSDAIQLFGGAIHNLWGFSAPGSYDLTFGFEAFLNGQRLYEESTFNFRVVPSPSAAGLLGIGAFAAMRRSR